MKKIWIEESGTCRESELLELLQKQHGEKKCYLAYYTDQFVSGYASKNELQQVDVKKLLEIRVFCAEREFLARRSMLGKTFSWRVASDTARKKNYQLWKEEVSDGEFIPEEEQTYLEHYHTLDINRDWMQKNGNSKNEHGCIELLTTVGGRYSLPIELDMNSVKIMSYLIYDENGMVKVADTRICEFVRRKGV